MLPGDVREKLRYLDDKKYEMSNAEVLLIEKEKAGSVILKCKLKNDTLIFHNPDKNPLPYLGNRNNARSCPDEFLFELDDDDTWILHIMEFKKTINTSSMKKSKIQFIMGIYNARAIAGFMNIKIKKIYIYSAYRNDNIETISPTTLIEMRNANSSKEDLELIKEWKNKEWKLNIDLQTIVFEHEKIQLDKNGEGTCTLKCS